MRDSTLTPLINVIKQYSFEIKNELTCEASSGCGAGVKKSVGAFGLVTGCGTKKFIWAPLDVIVENVSGGGSEDGPELLKTSTYDFFKSVNKDHSLLLVSFKYDIYKGKSNNTLN